MEKICQRNFAHPLVVLSAKSQLIDQELRSIVQHATGQTGGEKQEWRSWDGGQGGAGWGGHIVERSLPVGESAGEREEHSEEEEG